VGWYRHTGPNHGLTTVRYAQSSASSSTCSGERPVARGGGAVTGPSGAAIDLTRLPGADVRRRSRPSGGIHCGVQLTVQAGMVHASCRRQRADDNQLPRRESGDLSRHEVTQPPSDAVAHDSRPRLLAHDETDSGWRGRVRQPQHTHRQGPTPRRAAGTTDQGVVARPSHPMLGRQHDYPVRTSSAASRPFRRPDARDPWTAGCGSPNDRPASASGAGNRGSWPASGCSVGTCASR
jgi:hypothetical protein